MSQKILIDNIKVGWLHGLFITYLKKFEQTLHRLTNIIMKKLVEIVTIVATFALSCSSNEMRGMSNKQYLHQIRVTRDFCGINMTYYVPDTPGRGWLHATHWLNRMAKKVNKKNF